MTDREQGRFRRHRLLLELVQKEEISSQSQLQERLAQLGLSVNQATLSRDLRELGVIKVPVGNTGSRYLVPSGELPARNKNIENFRRLVLTIERSGNILVMFTSPGHAGAAALALDNLKFEGIVGTIAGDDTFIAVMREGKSWAAIHMEILEMAGLPGLEIDGE